MRSIERVFTVDRHGTLDLIIDDDPQHVNGYYSMVEGLRSHRDKSVFGHVSERIHGVSFCNDESYPGIQAADMLAYISRDYMVKRRNDPNVIPSPLYRILTRNLMHQPRFMTGEILEEVVRRAGIEKKLADENQ